MTGIAARRSRLLLLTLVLATALLGSGCYLRTLVFEAITVGGPGSYPGYNDGEFVVQVNALTVVAVCNSFPEHVFDCRYFLKTPTGDEVQIGSIAQHSGGGLLGFFIDPLILQVPQDVGVSQAFISNGPAPVPLEVSEVTSFSADLNRTVHAEPGRKFLIFELPPGEANAITATDPLAGHEFEFSLQFTSPVLPFEVKSMYPDRIDAGGESFYLPMLPCTTNFADVPSNLVDTILRPQALVDAFAVYEEMACDGEFYEMPAPPPGEYTVFVPALAAH